MVNARRAQAAQVKPANFVTQPPLSHFMNATYHPGSAHMVAAAFSEDDGDDGDDDGWEDGDGGSDSGSHEDDIVDDGGEGDGGGGDGYSATLTEYLNSDDTISLPSGASIQGCTAYYAIASMAAGIAGAAAGFIAGEITSRCHCWYSHHRRSSRSSARRRSRTCRLLLGRLLSGS